MKLIMTVFLLFLLLARVSSLDVEISIIEMLSEEPSWSSRESEYFNFEKAIVDFSFDLYRSIIAVEEKRCNNVLLSPISLMNILNLLVSGTSRATNAELRRALGYTGTLDERGINMKYQEIIRSLMGNNKGINVSMANQFFLRPDFKIKKTFLKKAKYYYNVGLKNLDFGKPKQTQYYINSWVKKQTRNLIPRMLSNPLDPLTVMVIVNAIYFKAAWKTPFDPEETFDGQFFVTKRKIENARFMYAKMKIPYVEMNEGGLDCKMISLAYGAGNYKYSMYFVLPGQKGPGGLRDLEEKLNGQNLLKMIERMEMLQVEVFIPKMKESASIELKKPLKEMGIHTLFDANRIDIKRLSEQRGLEVSDCFQKAFIEVNEEGTEAAAATAFITVARIASDSLSFMANRPFLYFIRDNETGAILFLGRQMKPSK